MLDVLLKIAGKLEAAIKEAAKSEVKEARTVTFPFGRIIANAAPYNSNRSDYNTAYKDAVEAIGKGNAVFESLGQDYRIKVPPVQTNSSPACRVEIVSVTLNDEQADFVREAIVLFTAALLSFKTPEKDLQDWGVTEDLRQEAAALIEGKRKARALQPAGV